MFFSNKRTKKKKVQFYKNILIQLLIWSVNGDGSIEPPLPAGNLQLNTVDENENRETLARHKSRWMAT